VCVLFVPETYHPILLSNKAAGLRNNTNKRYHSASDATRASKTLSQALAASLSVPRPHDTSTKHIHIPPPRHLISFLWRIPLVFVNNHHFNLWQVGLAFLGLLLGNLIACCCNPYWHKNWMELIAKMKANNGPEYTPEPELRLPPAMVGAVMVTVSLFWFAWTTFTSVHWIAPIIATIFFSIG
jgi:hypothetical protein